jgi:hypothetical protein
LYLAFIPYYNISLNANILAYDAVFTDPGSGEDMAEVPYFCAFTNFDIRVDEAAFMNKVR